MRICPECQTVNDDQARDCRHCRRVFSSTIGLADDAVAPPSVGSIPMALREQVGRLIDREVRADEPIAQVLADLASRASVVAEQGVLPARPPVAPALTGPMPGGLVAHVRSLTDLAALSDDTRRRVEAILGRPIGPDESLDPILASLAAHVTEVKSAAVPLPAPLPPPAPHRGLHEQVELVLGRIVGATEQPRDVIEELAKKVRDAAQAPHPPPAPAPPSGVAFPTPVAKILNVIPEKFKWIAALVLPLILGGGSGFMLTPSNKEPLAQAMVEVGQAKDQAIKANAELAVKTAEITHLSQDNHGLRANLDGQAKVLDKQLEEAHVVNATLEQNVKELTQNVKGLQQNLATTKSTADALRPFASRGFVEWKGAGGGPVTFNPGPSRGSIIDGAFPARGCVIVDVVGSEVDQPESLRGKGKDCASFAMQIKGRQNDSEKRVLLLWKAR